MSKEYKNNDSNTSKDKQNTYCKAKNSVRDEDNSTSIVHGYTTIYRKPR